MCSSVTKASVICLMGPTAAGKTALALSLAAHHPVDIISVDSGQIYREMDIGTAKPDRETLARAPHQLIDIRDPVESYSAEEFRQDAMAAIDNSLQQQRIPLLVGGTGLYFRALLQGLSELPASDEVIRSQLQQKMEEAGLASLHARLAAIDPQAAARIHPHDPQRILRALEVFEMTGQTISSLQAQGKTEFPYPVTRIVVSPSDRSVLHQQIEQRFLHMLEEGLEAEVVGLRERWPLNAQMPSMRSVGYRQVWSYLEGECDREQMIHDGIVATRRLAKRQLTWFRSEQDATWIEPGSGIKTLEQILEL